jgi:hypothetical protein
VSKFIQTAPSFSLIVYFGKVGTITRQQRKKKQGREIFLLWTEGEKPRKQKIGIGSGVEPPSHFAVTSDTLWILWHVLVHYDDLCMTTCGSNIPPDVHYIVSRLSSIMKPDDIAIYTGILQRAVSCIQQHTQLSLRVSCLDDTLTLVATNWPLSVVKTHALVSFPTLSMDNAGWHARERICLPTHHWPISS